MQYLMVSWELLARYDQTRMCLHNASNIGLWNSEIFCSLEFLLSLYTPHAHYPCIPTKDHLDCATTVGWLLIIANPYF